MKTAPVTGTDEGDEQRAGRPSHVVHQTAQFKRANVTEQAVRRGEGDAAPEDIPAGGEEPFTKAHANGL